MAKNILVISCEIAETRVALIEGGIIAELHIERSGSQPRGGTVGDICLGKVTRVLPGLQAAFVDIGLERAAFLHVEDLIRPDDFETYLAGGRKHALDGGGAAAAGDVAPSESDSESDAPVAPESGDESRADESGADGVPGDELGVDEASADDAGTDEESADASDEAEEDTLVGGPPRDEGVEDGNGDDRPLAASQPNDEDANDGDEPTTDPGIYFEPDPAPGAFSGTRIEVATPSRDPELALFDDPDLPGFTVSDPGVPPPKPFARADNTVHEARGTDKRHHRRGRGGRDRGGRGRPAHEPARERRPRPSAPATGRLSKSTPIRDVVKEGQEIIVQITKEPIGTKGARCSSHISLPGRYVVYLPTLDHVGVSKRIGNDKERARLRDTIEGMKPPSGGLIVRTVAEGLTKKQLKHDVGYLVRLWGEVAKHREGAKAPTMLYSELDIVLKTARDLFTDDVDQIVIDDRAQYDRLCRFVEMFVPERLKDVVFFNEDEPIFDAYGIEDEIARALSRKVPLPSGGYLIIDEAEALTAIDVNTGRYVGKGSKDMEETILKTNLEAVHEIAYQLRFRNIGGLVVLDLIDMEKPTNREKVRKTLEDLLQRDKAKTTLNRISELGLIEMTRKRTRESLGRLLHEPCFYCDGTGHLQSKETVAFEILREIRRKRHDLPGYTVAVNCHPAVADILTGSEKQTVTEAESRYMRRIQVTARNEYHLEQFDLLGK
jgi:ribonuclease G